MGRHRDPAPAPLGPDVGVAAAALGNLEVRAHGDAELIGVPRIVIVGRGAADGRVELWDRRTGDREVVAAAEAVALLTRRH